VPATGQTGPRKTISHVGQRPQDPASRREVTLNASISVIDVQQLNEL